MKIGIVHITDLHFKVDTNLENKPELIGNLIKNDFHDASHLYIVLSGDIAFSGKKEEYETAKKFLKQLKFFITYQNSLTIDFIITPGNHDCNFDLSNHARTTLINNINYSSIGTDNSVIDIILTVQKEFWDFYSHFNPIPKDRLFYSLKALVGDKTVEFTCLNTAWMSAINEKPGQLFFPVKRYIDKGKSDELSLATWHHPPNWFNPKTNENNKKEFEQLVETIGSFHFIGHEHEREYRYSENLVTDDVAYITAGKMFHNQGSRESGFQNISICLTTNESISRSYLWDSDHYRLNQETERQLKKSTKRPFTIDNDFEKNLNDPKIPLIFSEKRDVVLEDIFVFPDLESSTDTIQLDKLEGYVDSSRLLDKEYNNCVIEGDAQIGKSTLLSFLYLQFNKAGYVPILINGSDIISNNLDKLVKRSFNNQYNNSHQLYDKFLQLGSEKKILLIDDYHLAKLDIPSNKAFLEETSKKFGKVIIALDGANSILSNIQSEFSSWNFFGIKPFGYKKRNDLIERYHRLKGKTVSANDQEFLDQVRLSFDSVQNVLGNKLMPSYPIFIISILHAFEYRPLQRDESSYGHCYQALIYFSLTQVGVPNDDLDFYMHFLPELAYELCKRDDESIKDRDLEAFYANYRAKFISPSYENVITILRDARILISSESLVSFKYKYILYYLSAKRIADLIYVPEGKELIKNLFSDISNEKNANILVFITHHTKDISFIEECLIASMTILERVTPITLTKDDPFHSSIHELVEGLKTDILEAHRNPVKEREDNLAKRDLHERQLEYVKKDAEQLNKEILDETAKFILPFQQAFRSIEIIGQILRNRKGSLVRNQLHEMIKETYTTGFRTIGYINELLQEERQKIVESILEELEGDETAFELSSKVGKLIQMLCLKTCLTVFNKLMFSVGNKDLKEIYKTVAEDLDSPAAKLVSFSINAYYNAVSLNEIKNLKSEFKGNLVAMSILKARVKSYVYNRHMNVQTKQKIASVMEMTLSSKPQNQEKRKLDINRRKAS